MPSKLRLAPKTSETKLTFTQALQARTALKAATDRDPGYQAIRLRGLAGLLSATEEGTLGGVNNLGEVAFFVSTTLYDIAEALAPDVSGR